MHFALPPRKSSNPPPYARHSSSRVQTIRKSQLRILALVALSALCVIWLISRTYSDVEVESVPDGTPEVVIVTVLDEKKHSKEFLEIIKKNRDAYAEKHGYKTFFPTAQSYHLAAGTPISWSRIAAVRHALSIHPFTPYILHLSPTSLIMNPSLTITSHIMSPSRLESITIKDEPVVPPDSVIKTLPHQKAEEIDFVISQDGDGLGIESFIIRNYGGMVGKKKGVGRGEWAKFLVDSWRDPLLRSYNFQRGERHALEHIVQWHHTLLVKLAIVPQSLLNSYAPSPLISKVHPKATIYQPGDFIQTFSGCDGKARDCEVEMDAAIKQLELTEAKETVAGLQ